MNDNIDKSIKEILASDVKLSDEYKYIIRNTLKSKKEKRKIYYSRSLKLATVACGCIILSTSIVFAKDISNFFKNYFKPSDGMNRAIENGYILQTDMDYISSSDVETKVSNLLITDYNLSFSLNIRFNTDLKLEDIEKLNLSDLIITDNEDKILYCENENKFYEFCNEKNLNYIYKNFSENYINSGSNYYIKSKDLNKNEVELVYNLTSNNFPKSHTINIDFTKIDISSLTNTNNSSSVMGNWNMSIDLPEKFYNRNTISYRVKNCSKENLNVTKAIVDDTSMRLEFTIEETKIYNDGDSTDNIHLKLDNELETLKKEFSSGNVSNLELFKDAYVETENGLKFYQSGSSSEDGGYANDFMTGIITYWNTFDITKYDTTSNLKVLLKYKNEDIVIELEKQ